MKFEEIAGIFALGGVGAFIAWMVFAGRERRAPVAPMTRFRPGGARGYEGPVWRCQPIPGLDGLGIIRACRKKDIDRKNPKKKICLYSHTTGKLLGRHYSKKDAQRQEAAIHARRGW